MKKIHLAILPVFFLIPLLVAHAQKLIVKLPDAIDGPTKPAASDFKTCQHDLAGGSGQLKPVSNDAIIALQNARKTHIKAKQKFVTTLQALVDKCEKFPNGKSAMKKTVEGAIAIVATCNATDPMSSICHDSCTATSPESSHAECYRFGLTLPAVSFWSGFCSDDK